MAFYYDSEPTTASDKKLISYRQNGINFDFYTDTDVFSRSEVDFGTNLMLEAMIEDIKSMDSRPERFLDLGCGYGVVGIVMKASFKSMSVTSVDRNSRAVKLTKENADYNRIPLSKVVASDVLSELSSDEMFDMVATNPPVRAGKQTVFAFYEQAYAHMNDGACIYVVLQRKQGAPSTMKKLEELFGNCETLAISGGYRVMKSIKGA